MKRFTTPWVIIFSVLFIALSAASSFALTPSVKDALIKGECLINRMSLFDQDGLRNKSVPFLYSFLRVH